MRRVLSTVLVASGVLGSSLGLVGLSLGFGADAASAAAGKKVCTIADERMTELSGLVATSGGYVAVNDGSEDPDRERVFVLDSKCKIKKAVQYASSPRDPEDLAISPDGRTVWIADIGDNGTERRPNVVLWSMPVAGTSKPALHRLTFPGNKRHDAEALLIGADGVPLIITKTTGKAEIFRPAAALEKGSSEGVALAKAGEITLPKSTTANRFGPAGRLTITGAARSPDGTRIALRTYADAFEWDVKDNDIVKTLTSGTPRMTALADPFGEAIAYTPDGKTFLTVSDVDSIDEETDVTILSYVPAKVVAAAAADGEAGGTKKAGGSWTDSLTLDDITYLIAAVGVIGAVLVGLGIFGIVRARRRPREDGLGAAGPDGDDNDPRAGRGAAPGDDQDARRSGYDDGDGSNWGPPQSGGYGDGYRSDRPADDYEPAGRGRPAGGGVYGGKPAGGGGVYGGQPSGGGAGAGGGGVYGGGRPSGRPAGRPSGGGGGVYGGTPAAGGPPQGGRPGPIPAGRPRAGGGGGGGGGVYGGQPSGGHGGGRGGRPGPDEQQQRGGQRGGPPRNGQGPGPRGGQYGQPRQRSGGHPDDYDYR
ncbi:WD40 repeat domain-containing protein [Plantactinospora soyae]|uniref:Uncharacterized protein n=1 Tax=Plantactinospora soyae TaxID=1544732 RepID=A0A927M5C9_9ACTN|nr:hypothetical protein [Plantactinospora soyae]MBE1488014.1 hypothetical protein [Plantactinospora soyae]